MSISSIVSLGFGSWGAIAKIATLGYAIGSGAEHDYDVDECTVFTSRNRGELLSCSGRGDGLSSAVRGVLLSATGRGDLLESPGRGGLFVRECD